MFTSIFGEGPQVRVLDFLAEHPDFDYSIMEISRHSGVARPTVYKVVDALVRQGLLNETRRIGNSTFYRLDLSNPAVRRMLDMRAGFSHSGRGVRKGLPRGARRWSR